jgi:hypothetical protein
MFPSFQGEFSLIYLPKFRHCEERFLRRSNLLFLATKYEIASSQRTRLAMTGGVRVGPVGVSFGLVRCHRQILFPLRCSGSNRAAYSH